MNELREVKKTGFKIVEARFKNILGGLVFDFVEGDYENPNKRKYPGDMIEREIKRFNDELQKSKIAGQLNHPISSGTELDKIGHIITGVTYDKESKMGKAKALILNTTAGRNLMTLINSEVPFGASMRGHGTVNLRTRTVNDDYKLGTIDLVSNPSFGSKTMITKANLIESGNQILNDAFFSLRDNLSTAVKEKFGKDYWIVDFSPSEVVFRKEGQTEAEYQKISYKTKGTEIILTGDSETVKKKIQYEDEGNKMKKKKPGLTLDDIKRLRPDLLEQHEREILLEDEALLYRRFVEAEESGFRGTFEHFKKIAKNYEPEKLDESNLSQRRQDELKLEREKEEKGKLLKEDYKRYDTAIMAGYKGNFESFQKLMNDEDTKKKIEIKEAARSGSRALGIGSIVQPLGAGSWPHELRAAKQLEKELLRKAEVKRYLEDVQKGLWLGSFREWQLDQREQQIKELNKEDLNFSYPR